MKRIVLIRRKYFWISIIGIIMVLIFLTVTRFDDEKETTPQWNTINLTQIQVVSSEYHYIYYNASKDILQLLQDRLFAYDIHELLEKIPPQDYYRIDFMYKNGIKKTLYYSQLLDVFYNDQHYRLVMSQPMKETILSMLASFKMEVYKHYGALIPWEEVNTIFPLWSNAKIIDIYTGDSFMVQRRAGTHHVDAQPLTAEDTATMKKIYDGTWSWNRNGIVVETNGYRIAASMNGMPHGGGKIDDNNFPGHFCIHFLGSITHSGNMDTAHQREILKAAGKLPLHPATKE